jgi:putative oxidoreductase
MNTIETAILIVQGLLGLSTLASGGVKFLSFEFHTTLFDQFRYPRWFLYVTGGVETLGGLGLLAGLVFTPMFGVLGGILIIATMVGAILTRLVRVDEPLSRSIPAAIFLIAGLIVTSFLLLSFQP